LQPQYTQESWLMSANFSEESVTPEINMRAQRDMERQQAIQSDYYTITNSDGGPVAVLLVLLDRKRMPVRAELHLYATSEDDAREFAFRQARAILEKNYFSAELVPLQVLESAPLGDSILVRAQGINQPQGTAEWWPRWQLAAGAGALLLLLLLIWSIVRGLGNTTAPTSADSTIATQQPSNADNSASVAQATGPTATLLPSQRADPALAVGKRVRVKPNMKVSLVQEPGPDHPVVGYLENQQEATIISGPVLTQGQNDTIVWWRVRLGDGAEAWAPANTSEVTLLELAE
jgi:hypothetical protein